MHPENIPLYRSAFKHAPTPSGRLKSPGRNIEGAAPIDSGPIILRGMGSYNVTKRGVIVIEGH